MKKTVEFDIGWDGRRCQVTELSSQPALQVGCRILNLVGSAIREGAGSANVGEMDALVAGMLAVGAVLERLDAQTLDWLTVTFMKETRIEAEPGTGNFIEIAAVRDLAFGGGAGLARWTRWLAFSIDLNCSDFFAAAFAEATRLQSTTKAKMDPIMGTVSPITSSKNGTSTASL